MAAVFEQRASSFASQAGRNAVVFSAVLTGSVLLLSCGDSPKAPEVVVAAVSSAPETGCTMQTYGEHEYWFCNTPRTGDEARTRCAAQPWMHLARIDDTAERSFLESHFTGSVWLGGSDSLTEGTWRWLDNADPFWSGNQSGQPVAGRFTNWRSGQPDDRTSTSSPAAVLTQLWNPASLTNPSGTCTAQAFGDSAYWTCTQALTWDTARSRCTAVGAELVSIATQIESNFIDAIATGSGEWLIGAQRRGLAGGSTSAWQWLDGTSATSGFTNWGLFEPGVLSTCSAIASDLWKSWSCSSSKAFICEDTTTQAIPDAQGPQIVDVNSAQRRFAGSTLGLSNGVAVSGVGCGIGAASTDAVFWLNLIDSTTLSIDLTSSTFANARVALFRSTLDAQGYAAGGSRCAAVATGSAVELQAELAAGSYYVVLTSTSGTGAYDVTFTGAPVADCLLATRSTGWADEVCNRTNAQHAYICESDVSNCTVGVDGDLDGVPDCFDGCPADASHQIEGTCGCPSDPAADGAPCSDGICAANQRCDGAGNCGDPMQCAPDTECSYERHGDMGYYFCENLRTGEEARAQCSIQPGMHLVHVRNEDESAFLNARVSAASWIGATDANVEGFWLWPDDGTQFWGGAVSGSAVSSRYEAWRTSEAPNNFDGLGWPIANCAALETGLSSSVQPAAWSDFACHDQRQRFGFTCEIPLRTECLLSSDLDADGTLDCRDTCPLDPNKVVPGDCGCANAPLAVGTSCDDGLCAANNQCDGAGSCGEPLDCAPSSSCVPTRFAGKVYWSCAGSFTWTSARDLCRSQPGVDLVRIDDEAENDFVAELISGTSWIGANDRSVGTDWRWAQRPSDNGAQFWEASTSSSVNGLFESWGSGEPGLSDCGQIVTAGTWRDQDCAQNGFGFVCETVVDHCGLDLTKYEPGQCGCGVPDTDGDQDGTPNCLDDCPTDANKVQPLLCGCGQPETDNDGDGTANCVDGCPSDAGKVSAGICGCGISDADGDGDGVLNCQDQCPVDPRKSMPGFCGCGETDVDSDDDGVPDCSELCPDDPEKLQPGSCGCGVADVDSDGDTTLDCFDECPTDETKVVVGACGCASDPQPAGTACGDGLCAANTACDGMGQCGDYAECAPEPGCVIERQAGRLYFFCPGPLSWEASEAACNGRGFRQPRIESAAENAYLTTRMTDMWLGARDTSEGTWTWQDSTNDLFWSGGPNGGPIGGRYQSWAFEQPDDLYGATVYPATATLTQLWDSTLAAAIPPTGGCTGYAYNSRAYWSCTSNVSWDTARTRCQAAGGDLVSIGGAAEDAFIGSISQAFLINWHVGLRRGVAGASSTTWRWLDGTLVPGTFTHWGLFEPGGSTCGAMMDGAWRAQSCSASTRFVCERPTPALKVPDLVAPQAVNVYGATRLFRGSTQRTQDVVNGTLMGCGAGAAAPDAVFSFTLSERTHLTIDLAGSDADTKVGIFSAAITAQGYANAGSECTSTGTLLEETLEAGTYYAVVTGNASNGRSYQVLFSGVRQGSPGADCALFDGGTWIDTSCAQAQAYACEVPIDECPADGTKLLPGVCGCGNPDSDGDGDGSPNCADRCPLDAHQIEPGDCGCASAPERRGTPCGTGLCAANDGCDGAGRCGDPIDCAPAENCVFAEYVGMQARGYFFCPSALDWSSAQAQCARQPRMQLARIGDSVENAFVTSRQADSSWIGASDRTAERQWYWRDGAIEQGAQFWNGDENGAGVGGLYTNWTPYEPNDLFSEDCAAMATSGTWNDLPCGNAHDYVCEINADLCPDDWTKWEPGECGCGVPESDTDSDGVKDCFDSCPFDAARTLAAQGHCGFTFVGDQVLRTDGAEGPVGGAADGAGNVLFVWQTQRGDHAELHARRFNALGTLIDWVPIVLDENVSLGWAAEPRAAGLSAGGWAVVWTDEDGDRDLSGIALRMISSAGVPGTTGAANRDVASMDTEVGSEELLFQWGARVAPVDDGFVVVWVQQARSDESGTAIRARLFSRAGRPLGAAFGVAASTQGDQLSPEVAGKGQDWLVAWEDFDSAELRARRFVGDAPADPEGEELVIASDAHSAALAPLGTAGDFGVAWVTPSFEVDAATLRAGEGIGAAVRVAPSPSTRPEERPSAARYAADVFAVGFQYTDGYHDSDFGIVDPLDVLATQPGEAVLRARLASTSNQSQVLLVETPTGIWVSFVDDGLGYYGGASQLAAFFLRAP